jgi:hypothetical protein
VASTSSETLAYLRSARAVRERCQRVLLHAVDDELEHFTVELGKLQRAADLVAEVTTAAYPDLRVPVHGRLRHFDAGGVPRTVALAQALSKLDAAEQARAKLDLIVVSVLLDAGAGTAWRYREAETGLTLARSEGLAVASLRMFLAGAFSGGHGARADAAGLAALTAPQLAAGFQVGDNNPLVGVGGRLSLLHALARVLPRPGALYDAVVACARGGEVRAADILGVVLDQLGPIWPGRVTLDGVNLGDVWPCARLAGPKAPVGDSLVPFHKLSQWLSYSMVEVLEEAGLVVGGLDELTGLAEYRNGGLFVDSGVIVPRDAALAHHTLHVGDEAVVEWRALTVALLDRLAPLVRERLGKSADELPLAAILEGGTWAAGRKLAEERRGGAPPFKIQSDGTVF